MQIAELFLAVIFYKQPYITVLYLLSPNDHLIQLSFKNRYLQKSAAESQTITSEIDEYTFFLTISTLEIHTFQIPCLLNI